MPSVDPPPGLARIRLLALDVDGVLTDGGVYYDSNGVESKRFQIHDGLGIVVARLAGLRIAWITGRTSPIVERRAAELGVDSLLQGVRDKAIAIDDLADAANLTLDEVAYIGDDLNDLTALRLAGVAIAPANAASPEVRDAVDWITPRGGGEGAARDAIEAILRARGEWVGAVESYLNSLEPDCKTPLQ